MRQLFEENSMGDPIQASTITVRENGVSKEHARSTPWSKALVSGMRRCPSARKMGCPIFTLPLAKRSRRCAMTKSQPERRTAWEYPVFCKRFPTYKKKNKTQLRMRVDLLQRQTHLLSLLLAGYLFYHSSVISFSPPNLWLLIGSQLQRMHRMWCYSPNSVSGVLPSLVRLASSTLLLEGHLFSALSPRSRKKSLGTVEVMYCDPGS